VNGEILAWVGGRDYSKNQFDRVSQAFRQPGSSFKPFVYLTALDKTLNNYRVARTTNLLADEPITFDIPGSTSWTPENYDKEYNGEVTVREALMRSLNIPTVNLAMKVGDRLDQEHRRAVRFWDESTRGAVDRARSWRSLPLYLGPRVYGISERWSPPQSSCGFTDVRERERGSRRIPPS
jgi:membrane carboxypeptidase/penicillin-binding protein